MGDGGELEREGVEVLELPSLLICFVFSYLSQRDEPSELSQPLPLCICRARNLHKFYFAWASASDRKALSGPLGELSSNPHPLPPPSPFHLSTMVKLASHPVDPSTPNTRRSHLSKELLDRPAGLGIDTVYDGSFALSRLETPSSLRRHPLLTIPLSLFLSLLLHLPLLFLPSPSATLPCLISHSSFPLGRTFLFASSSFSRSVFPALAKKYGDRKAAGYRDVIATVEEEKEVKKVVEGKEIIVKKKWK